MESQGQPRAPPLTERPWFRLATLRNPDQVPFDPPAAPAPFSLQPRAAPPPSTERPLLRLGSLLSRNPSSATLFPQEPPAQTPPPPPPPSQTRSTTQPPTVPVVSPPPRTVTSTAPSVTSAIPQEQRLPRSALLSPATPSPVARRPSRPVLPTPQPSTVANPPETTAPPSVAIRQPSPPPITTGSPPPVKSTSAPPPSAAPPSRPPSPPVRISSPTTPPASSTRLLPSPASALSSDPRPPSVDIGQASPTPPPMTTSSLPPPVKSTSAPPPSATLPSRPPSPPVRTLSPTPPPVPSPRLPLPPNPEPETKPVVSVVNAQPARTSESAAINGNGGLNLGMNQGDQLIKGVVNPQLSSPTIAKAGITGSAATPGKKKSGSSDEAESRIKALTLAGENLGAYVNLGSGVHRGNTVKGDGRYLTQNQSVAQTIEKVPLAPGSNGTGDASVGRQNYSPTKDAKSRAKPMAALVNSNVQSVNNSILFNSSCTQQSPGVYITLSNGNRRPPSFRVVSGNCNGNLGGNTVLGMDSGRADQ